MFQVSLPGGAASELEIVMKLHTIERHIRKNKLKVRSSHPSQKLHAYQSTKLPGLVTRPVANCIVCVGPGLVCLLAR